MATLTEIVNTKVNNDDVTKIISGDELLLGYWEDLTGVVSSGEKVKHSSETWQAVSAIADITASEPSSSNDDWIKLQEGVFSYVVSQLNSGVSSTVGYIYTGLTVDSYEFLIYPDDGRVFSVDAVTGTLSGDFDPANGSDTGLSGNLTNVEVSFDFLKEDATEVDTGVVRYATSAEVDSRTGTGVVTAENLPSLVETERVQILSYGSYTSGTYSYPGSYDQDDFEDIYFLCASGPSANMSGITGTLTDGQKQAYPTSWQVRVTSAAGQELILDYASSTSFTVSNDGNDQLREVWGILK